MSLRLLWDSIYELCQVSVHREGVDPNSMEGVRDLDHISVGPEILCCTQGRAGSKNVYTG